MTDIDRLKKLTGEGDEVLLSLLLEDGHGLRAVLYRSHKNRDWAGKGRA